MPKTKTAPAPYKHLVTEAIIEDGDRRGSSRQFIVKYLQKKYKLSDDCRRYINNAISTGVEDGIFTRPKGPSGRVRVSAAHRAAFKRSQANKKAAAKPKKKTTKKKTTKKKTTKRKAVKKKTTKKSNAKKSKAAAKKKRGAAKKKARGKKSKK